MKTYFQLPHPEEVLRIRAPTPKTLVIGFGSILVIAYKWLKLFPSIPKQQQDIFNCLYTGHL